VKRVEVRHLQLFDIIADFRNLIQRREPPLHIGTHRALPVVDVGAFSSSSSPSRPFACSSPVVASPSACGSLARRQVFEHCAEQFLHGCERQRMRLVAEPDMLDEHVERRLAGYRPVEQHMLVAGRRVFDLLVGSVEALESFGVEIGGRTLHGVEIRAANRRSSASSGTSSTKYGFIDQKRVDWSGSGIGLLGWRRGVMTSGAGRADAGAGAGASARSWRGLPVGLPLPLLLGLGFDLPGSAAGPARAISTSESNN